MVVLLEHADDTRVINSLHKYGQQVIEEERVLLQVVCQCTVVDLDVSNLGQDGLELIMVPCIRAVLHDRERCIVWLIVLDIQEHKLAPEVCPLRHLDELRQIAPRPVQLEVLHQL